MHTRDIGRAFFHFVRVQPGSPIFHTAPTVEIEEPFRRSDSLVVRLPFRRAIVLGWWEDTGWDADTALMEAVWGWGIDPYDDRLQYDESVRQTIRENIAANISGDDPTVEWQIISALGVEV
jgi:hypothetical protein